MSAASASTATSWQWPSCTQARTMSFRRADIGGRDDEASSTHSEYKTRVITNPAYCDNDDSASAEHSFLFATDSSDSTTATDTVGPVAPSEMEEVILRGIRSSSRLFFEPEATSSMVKPASAGAFGGARVMAIDSADPYGDFRRSMEEMVLSHGGGGENDWGWLEEMLGWYLRANGKKTHGLITHGRMKMTMILALVALLAGGDCDEEVDEGAGDVACSKYVPC